MPLQNRVDPYGDIHALAARGTLMGNRGLLHSKHKELIKSFQLKRWIICVLEFKDRRREVMRKGHYTELFFKDEVSALAAGHRPCAECQRSKFNEFKQAWSTGNHLEIGKIEELDTVLHHERLFARNTGISLRHLPDGIFVDYKKQACLWYQEKLYPWSFESYGPPIDPPATEVQLLTPISSVRAIAQGYTPDAITIVSD